MPTIFVWRGHRFFFYSADGGEPPHVHIRKGASECKIWLHDAGVAYNYGYAAAELGVLIRHVKARRDELQEAWNDYFGD
jgi:hypothetical protein